MREQMGRGVGTVMSAEATQGAPRRAPGVTAWACLSSQRGGLNDATVHALTEVVRLSRSHRRRQ